MAKKKRVKSVFLPLELIMEILLRLPVKTLLYCRCVCKSWLSLISNNNFVTSHFEHSSTHRRLFIKPYALQPLSIDVDSSLDDASAYASLTLDFVRSQRSLRIIGSCRGFLFLHGDIDFYLWNPSTGAHKQIPATPITLIHGFELLSGFGYDKSTDDYFIVSVFLDDGLKIKLMIFSLRTNKWKSMEVASYLPDMTIDCVPECGLFLSGSIHWIVNNQETFKNVIIAFDLKEMAMLEIALPDDLISISDDDNESIYYDLLEVGGLISAWMIDLNTVKIYVMQEYRVHSSWTKIIQFSYDPVLHNNLYILCLTKCGDIVGRNDKGRLVKFNDKGKLLEQPLCHKNYMEIYDLVAYRESLISLPNTDQTRKMTTNKKHEEEL